MLAVFGNQAIESDLSNIMQCIFQSMLIGEIVGQFSAGLAGKIYGFKNPSIRSIDLSDRRDYSRGPISGFGSPR